MDLRRGRVLVTALGLVVVAGSSVAAMGGTAVAEGWSPADKVLSVSPDHGPVGTVFTVTGEDCPYHGARVWVHVSSEQHEMVSGRTVHTGDDGAWAAALVVPEGQAPDTYSVIARCYSDDPRDGDTIGYQGTFTVTAATAPTATPPTTAAPAPATRPRPVRVRPSYTG